MRSGIGVWEPKKPVSVDEALLRRLSHAMSEAVDNNLSSVLSREEVSSLAGLMKLPAGAWSPAQALDDAELDALVRFFTLAEMQFTGWDGGKDSPVIPLVKILKSRDAFGADLRKWIKANSDNRFLPYGSAL
ncbi:MAG: hypothetical protein KDI19_03090 [Pseudomonadales bacterium]|nr:hypothetical protein [Pseudomonadales bacterium]